MPASLAARARRSVPSKFTEYVVGRIEVTERVVGQGSETDHRVVADQLAGLSVPHVARGPHADVLQRGPKSQPS